MRQATPFKVAEEIVARGAMNSGTPGMVRTSAPPGANAMMSPVSSVDAPVQQIRNEQLSTQNKLQNTLTQAPQAAAAAKAEFEKGMLIEQNADYLAQMNLKRTMGEILVANGSGTANMTLHAKMTDPVEGVAFRNHLVTSKAMAMGVPPALVQHYLQA